MSNPTPAQRLEIHSLFLIQGKKHNLEPSVAVFRYLFKFVNAPNDEGWVKIQYRTLGRNIFVSDSAPDSLPHRKKQWFYLYMCYIFDDVTGV